MSSLAGKRVVITRPREKSDAFSQDLQARGAVPILLPTVEIKPINDNVELDDAIEHIDRYDWAIFTSANGVVTFWQRLAAKGLSPVALKDVSIAAVGSATAKVLRARGFDVRFVPEEFVAERIIEGVQ